MGYAITVFTYIVVGGAKYFQQFHHLIVAIHYFLKRVANIVEHAGYAEILIGHMIRCSPF